MHIRQLQVGSGRRSRSRARARSKFDLLVFRQVFVVVQLPSLAAGCRALFRIHDFENRRRRAAGCLREAVRITLLLILYTSWAENSRGLCRLCFSPPCSGRAPEPSPGCARQTRPRPLRPQRGSNPPRRRRLRFRAGRRILRGGRLAGLLRPCEHKATKPANRDRACALHFYPIHSVMIRRAEGPPLCSPEDIQKELPSRMRRRMPERPKAMKREFRCSPAPGKGGQSP